MLGDSTVLYSSLQFSTVLYNWCSFCKFLCVFGSEMWALAGGKTPLMSLLTSREVGVRAAHPWPYSIIKKRSARRLIAPSPLAVASNSNTLHIPYRRREEKSQKVPLRGMSRRGRKLWLKRFFTGAIGVGAERVAKAWQTVIVAVEDAVPDIFVSDWRRPRMGRVNPLAAS